MSRELRQKIDRFKTEYLATSAGQKHLGMGEAEKREVKRVFADILQKHQAGEDITEDVLKRLLPHTDTTFHRENGYRVSTWPCIRKDVKEWFEASGWKEPHEWQPTARLIVEAINGLVSGNKEPWTKFLGSPYRHGFGTGFISPILFCLDDSYPVITSKVVKTYQFCTEQLGDKDSIDAHLVNYLENAEKVRSLVKKLKPFGIDSLHEFDLLCHYLVSKRLGGKDLTKAEEVQPQFNAWLFVANPDIFKWEEAFEHNGVEWTESKGPYPQKLLREQIRAGHRVFGYQAGPDYEVRCELRVENDPYLTAGETWAVNLAPVRWAQNPVSLSTLQENPNLARIKFVKTPQISISGVDDQQAATLEALLDGEEQDAVREERVSISALDRLRKELLEAQHDTRNPDRFEAALATAFEFLGFEAEHVGGSGDTDVLVTAQLGPDTYIVVVDGKTCTQGKSVGQVNYQPINSHKEANEAQYALVVAPAFSGGNTVTFAEQAKVSLLTTETLLTLLRQHDQFPYDLEELRTVFEEWGVVEQAMETLNRIHMQHDASLQLVNDIINIFEDFQRQKETSEPLETQAVHLVLQVKASAGRAPQPQQVTDILTLLSNSVLNILQREGQGYVLRMSAAAARKRIEALESMFGVEETGAA